MASLAAAAAAAARVRPAPSPRRARPRRRVARRVTSGAHAPDDREPREEVVVEPRMTFGLDVHRRIHAKAMAQNAYRSQWRAYCERASRDWRDAVSDDDEAVLCSFQYELERGIERFEAAKAAGTLDAWPPGTLHPTTGLPAVAGAFRAAVADACGGRKELFVGIDG